MHYLKTTITNSLAAVVLLTVLVKSLFDIAPASPLKIVAEINQDLIQDHLLIDSEDPEDLNDTSEPFQTDTCEELAPALPSEPKIIIHPVKAGDTLSSIWSRYTVNTSGAIHAANALKEVNLPLSCVKAGDDIELQLSTDGDITALRKKLEKGRVLLLDGDSFNGYKPNIIEPVYTEEEKVVTGSISSSLAKDALDRGVPHEVIDSFVDLLANDIDFRRDLQRGDTYSVSYTLQQTEDGEIISVGPIQAASIIVKGKLHAAISYIGKDKKRRYYDENGNAIGDYFLRYPLQYTRISSVFSNSRLHPVLKIRRPHLGIDFAAPVGTPVRSIGAGRVTFAGFSGAAGRMIKIQHNAKYSTAYLHLSAIKKGLKKRDTVERGEVIGYVGSSGMSTGPHLDFRFAVNGVYVDPLKVDLPNLSTSDEKIPQQVLRAALADINQAHQAQSMLALLRAIPKKKFL